MILCESRDPTHFLSANFWPFSSVSPIDWQMLFFLALYHTGAYLLYSGNIFWQKSSKSSENVQVVHVVMSFEPSRWVDFGKIETSSILNANGFSQPMKVDYSAK